MARIKIICLIIMFLFVVQAKAYSAEIPNLSTLVTPQNVSYDLCNKTFNMSAEKLFYLSLASVGANKFRIDEMQSKTGYILFTAVNKQFLATVIKIDKEKTLLKITPTDNVYYFPPGVAINIFRYIEVNKDEQIVNISGN